MLPSSELSSSSPASSVQRQPSGVLGSSLSSSDTVDIMVASAGSSMTLTQVDSLQENSTSTGKFLTSSSLVSSSACSSDFSDHDTKHGDDSTEVSPTTRPPLQPPSNIGMLGTMVKVCRTEISSSEGSATIDKEQKEMTPILLPDLKENTQLEILQSSSSSLHTSSPVSLLLETPPIPQRNLNSTNRRGLCCVCQQAAFYTCPACGKGVCSVACSRAHKQSLPPCSGLPDPTAKVLLKDFTDRQFIRDFHFLEDCRRLLGNIERQKLPGGGIASCGAGAKDHASALSGAKAPRKAEVAKSTCNGIPSSQNVSGNDSSAHYTLSQLRGEFRGSLPSTTSDLQQAALRRGICCYILSSGMSRRMANTSRCLPDQRICWRCEFNFYKGSEVAFTLSIDEAMETARVGELLLEVWSLDKQHKSAVQKTGKEGKQHELQGGSLSSSLHCQATVIPSLLPSSSFPVEQKKASDEKDKSGLLSSEKRNAHAHVSCALSSSISFSSINQEEEDGSDDESEEKKEWRRWNKACCKIHKKDAEKVEEGMWDLLPFLILYKIPRVGIQPQRFCKVIFCETLLESLQRVKVVTEYPTFEVVMAEDLHLFPLMSDDEFSAWSQSASSRLLQIPLSRRRGAGRGGRERKQRMGKAKEENSTSQPQEQYQRPPALKRGRGVGGPYLPSRKRFS